METTNQEKTLVQVASILKSLKIKYFITGGFAISVWGRPRATFDIDIVVQLLEPKIEILAQALKKIYEKGYIDKEMMREAIRHKGEFNFIDSERGAKVDFWLIRDDEWGRLQLKRRKPKIISGSRVYFISPEDLILNKLLWHKQSESTRQLEDIESVIKISGKKLDKKYLKYWARKLGVIKALIDRCGLPFLAFTS